MSRQLRYPMVFLLVFLLWATTRSPSSGNSLIPSPLPTLPVLLLPSGSIGADDSPTYTWREAAGVTWYHLRVKSVSENGSTPTVYDQWHQTATVCSDTTCSVTPALTLNPGRYTWSIQIWNDSEFGTWTSEMDFSVTMQGTAYYVSPVGNDEDPGTESSPWKTIQKAANTVTSGSTVIVSAGNYAERVKINKSGTSEGAITFRTQGTVITHGFTVQASYVTIRGFEVTNTPDDPQNGWGIFVNGSNCLIEDNYIHYATRGGILLFAQPRAETVATNCVVRNNRLYRNALVGIWVTGRNHLIEDNEIWGTIQFHPKWINQPPRFADADGIRFFGSGHIFRGNYVHDISLDDPENINPHIDAFQTWDGDDVEAGNNCIFEKNKIVLGRGTAGFQLEGGTHDLTIRNNIVQAFSGILSYKNGKFPYTSPGHLFVLNNLFIGDLTYAPSDGPGGVTMTDTTNVVVKNNIFMDQPYYVINISGSSGIDVNYNMAYNSDGSSPIGPVGTPMLHNLWGVNPLFVNPGVGDYHLQAESPAIDAGAFLNDVNDDFDGNSRPQGKGYDIGAYEYLIVSQP